jgi:hypothetical protein
MNDLQSMVHGHHKIKKRGKKYKIKMALLIAGIGRTLIGQIMTTVYMFCPKCSFATHHWLG